MAITVEQLTLAAQITLRAATLPEAVRELRQTLPGLRASTVDALDMRGETPAVHLGKRDLFLMESDGHCWSVTGDPAQALGVVLTEHD